MYQNVMAKNLFKDDVVVNKMEILNLSIDDIEFDRYEIIKGDRINTLVLKKDGRALLSINLDKYGRPASKHFTVFTHLDDNKKEGV